jgi:AcrR family transcriptional regulator
MVSATGSRKRRTTAGKRADPPPAAARIVSGARNHFFAHGFRSVTMDDLARELGMSKKTLYASFPSKKHLVQATILDKFSELDLDLERITSRPSSSFPATLHRLLECFQHHAGEIQPPFVRDMRREAPEVFQLIETKRREHIQRHFGRVLEQGRRAGLVRKDIPARIVIEVLLGAVQAILNPQKVQELGLSPATGLLTIMSVILDGALTQKGKEKP